MVYLIIYIIGFIAVPAHLIYVKRKVNDITLFDLFGFLLLGIFSWLFIILELVGWLCIKSEKIIVLKKKNIL